MKLYRTKPTEVLAERLDDMTVVNIFKRMEELGLKPNLSYKKEEDKKTVLTITFVIAKGLKDRYFAEEGDWIVEIADGGTSGMIAVSDEDFNELYDGPH